MIYRLDTLAAIGYYMYCKGMTKEELDNLSPFNAIMLKEDFDRMLSDDGKTIEVSSPTHRS